MSVTAQAPEPTLSLSRQGHYAGVASRGVAFAADVGALWLLYTLGVALVAVFWQLVTGKTFSLTHHQGVEIAVLIVWWFVYFSYQWTLGGRTRNSQELWMRNRVQAATDPVLWSVSVVGSLLSCSLPSMKVAPARTVARARGR